MTSTELEKREAALASAGYHKSRATSSTNDYSWFRTIKNPADPEEWLYMIEWRVWSWIKYADRDPYCVKRPYSMELCILVNVPDESPAKMTHPDILTITDAETLARSFYDLINPKNKNHDKRRILLV